ncbi:MAG: nuclear transport factor 2 family protein [Candidatus Acidiferrum sp.]|jgi:predicted SnoaL-like aldol condensation-catalyzing enzyme
MPASPEPTPEQNKRLLHRWLDELWNQGRRQTITELFSKTGILHSGNRHSRGPAEFLHYYDIMHSVFSQFSIKPVVTLAEGDLVCVHWAVDCVHTVSRTPVHTTGITVARVKDGQFIEGWQNWDAIGITQQIPGLVLPY